jgi:hypothetical protein
MQGGKFRQKRPQTQMKRKPGGNTEAVMDE